MDLFLLTCQIHLHMFRPYFHKIPPGGLKGVEKSFFLVHSGGGGDDQWLKKSPKSFPLCWCPISILHLKKGGGRSLQPISC